MDEDEDKAKPQLPVTARFEVGATARLGATAHLGVKAEVPKEVTGRVVDSLLDVIRPFTERRGLRADQIRLQREDVLCEIAMKARRRAEIEKLTLNPVPNKLLIPYLEKASIESDDEEMKDRWAALLLSASQSFHARHLTFVDILGRLSSDELRILETICFSYDNFPALSYPHGHSFSNRNTILTHASILKYRDPPMSMETIYGEFTCAAKLQYGEHLFATVKLKDHQGWRFCYTEYSSPYPRNWTSVQILERERLVDICYIYASEIGHDSWGDEDPKIGYFEATDLAISLVAECSPEAANVIANRTGEPPVVE